MAGRAHQLVDLDIEEVSAVDHPANKRKFLVVKRAGSRPPAEGNVENVNKRDVAASVALLKTAFPKHQLVSKAMEQLLTKYADEAETFDEVRAEDRLRQELWKLTDALNYSIQSIMNDDTVGDKQSLLTQTFMQFLVALSNLSPAIDGTIEKIGAKVSAARAAKIKATLEALKAAIGPLEAVMEEAMAQKNDTTAAKAGDKVEAPDLSKIDATKKAEILAWGQAMEKRATDAETKNAELEKRISDLEKAAKSPDAPEDPLAKADPAVKAVLKKQEDELAELRKAREEDQKIAKAERDQRLTTEAITKAKADYPRFGNAETLGPIMKKARGGEALDAADCDELERCMKAANEQLKDSKLFRSIGKTEETDATAETAAEEAKKRALELIQKDSKLSMADALTQVFREDKALYKRHRAESTQRGSGDDEE